MYRLELLCNYYIDKFNITTLWLFSFLRICGEPKLFKWYKWVYYLGFLFTATIRRSSPISKTLKVKWKQDSKAECDQNQK